MRKEISKFQNPKSKKLQLERLANSALAFGYWLLRFSREGTV